MAEFRGRRVVDSDLQNASRLHRMRFFDLIDTSITDAGLLALRAAAQLQELSLSSELITDEMFAAVGSLPKLVSLLIHSAPRITGFGLPQLENIGNLHELYLNNTAIDDVSLPFLKQAVSLRVLSLASTHITDDGASILGEFSSLEHLVLTGVDISGVGFADWSPSAIEHLDLSETRLDDSGLEIISRVFPRVRRLRVDGTSLTDQAIEFLQRCGQLETVSLGNTVLSSQAIVKLADIPTLQGVVVNSDVLDESQKQAIRKRNRRLSVYEFNSDQQAQAP